MKSRGGSIKFCVCVCGFFCGVRVGKAGVLGMVQIEFLEVKLLNFVKIAHFCALGQKRVKYFSMK